MRTVLQISLLVLAVLIATAGGVYSYRANKRERRERERMIRAVRRYEEDEEEDILDV